MEEKYIVRIPKVGTYIHGMIYPFYVDENYQRIKIEEAKQMWKHTISAPKKLISKMVEDDDYIRHGKPMPYYMEYSYADNPYYGWKEEQLEIVIE